MSELIKREDAINAVEMFFKDAYIEDADVHCADMVYEIDHIPTASPWHRVEDELPDKNGRYLAFDRENGVQSAIYIKQRKRSEWTDEAEEWCDFPVTHWMPLPEPPKEDA